MLCACPGSDVVEFAPNRQQHHETREVKVSQEALLGVKVETDNGIDEILANDWHGVSGYESLRVI